MTEVIIVAGIVACTSIASFTYLGYQAVVTCSWSSVIPWALGYC